MPLTMTSMFGNSIPTASGATVVLSSHIASYIVAIFIGAISVAATAVVKAFITAASIITVHDGRDTTFKCYK
jgi:hypothetical protein